MQNEIDLAREGSLLGRTSLFGNDASSETGQRVTKYFETSGFSRWSAIYGDAPLPRIWSWIREGHTVALERVIEWLADDRPGTALDAGCGTGTLTYRLADSDYAVDAFDVSAPMVSFARYMNGERALRVQPTFQVGDIAALEAPPRSYDLVCCLDVLFHYPYDEVEKMLSKLASLSSRKLIGSFAVSTPLNSFWMVIGKKFFHKKNRMTSIHLFSYDQVERILYRAGYKITRTYRVKKFVYDSFVFEAVRRT
jgi:magnesium-protoporphyrin O-methyltransferase